MSDNASLIAAVYKPLSSVLHVMLLVCVDPSCMCLFDMSCDAWHDA